jgi:hypothetical protein
MDIVGLDGFASLFEFSFASFDSTLETEDDKIPGLTEILGGGGGRVSDVTDVIDIVSDVGSFPDLPLVLDSAFVSLVSFDLLGFTSALLDGSELNLILGFDAGILVPSFIALNTVFTRGGGNIPAFENTIFLPF